MKRSFGYPAFEVPPYDSWANAQGGRQEGYPVGTRPEIPGPGWFPNLDTWDDCDSSGNFSTSDESGFGQFYYDPSTFGQAFVPGTVPPPLPANAAAPAQPSGYMNPQPGMPTFPAATSSTGIAPTYSLAELENASVQVNSTTSVPMTYLAAGIALLLLLK